MLNQNEVPTDGPGMLTPDVLVIDGGPAGFSGDTLQEGNP